MNAPLMTNREHFQDEERLQKYLAHQLKAGRLAVILGSGISYHFGLPTWEELVKRLYFVRKETLPNGQNTLEDLAEFFRSKFYKDDTDGYLNAVQEALYENVSLGFAKFHEHNLLASIASLVMSSIRGSSSELITFNFDNLLEIYLMCHGFVVRSVIQEQYWASYSDVTVYHPHGFLPLDATQDKSEDIVFDQKSYSLIVSDAGKFWRFIIYNIMFHRTCLFIGLSGRDTNLDRLLIDSVENHPCKKENALFWGITFSDREDQVASMRWEERGIFYKFERDYNKALPIFLFGICERAAHL